MNFHRFSSKLVCFLLSFEADFYELKWNRLREEDSGEKDSCVVSAPIYKDDILAKDLIFIINFDLIVNC